MNLIQFISCLFLILLAVPTLYLAVIVAAAWLVSLIRMRSFVPSAFSPSSESFSVLVIVPAHNEESGLTRTLTSLDACRRSGIEIKVAVIADNCTDDTESVAAAGGALVFVRTDPAARGKGQALNWFINEQRQLVESVDYCAIIDADTVVESAFVCACVGALAASRGLVAQGFYGVLNPNVCWRTRLMAAALAVFHHLRPLGRRALGGTAGLKGNGMMFHRSVLLQYGWPAFSNVEDVEFSVQLALDGVAVDYVPGARVYGEMPTGRRQAEIQRGRWEGGRWMLARTYIPQLVKAFLRKPRRVVLDAILDLTTPPLGLLIALQLVAAIVGLLVGMPTVWGGAIAMIAIAVIYVGSGLFLRRESLSIWLALAAAPIYVLWKIIVYARLRFRGDAGAWKRTPRENEIDNAK